MPSQNYNPWFMIFLIPELVHPPDSVFSSEHSSSWSSSTVWTCYELESDPSAVESCSSPSSSDLAWTSSWLPLGQMYHRQLHHQIILLFLAELPLIRWTLFRFSNQFAQFRWCAFNRQLLNINWVMPLMNTSTITTLVVTCWHLSTSPSIVVLVTNMSSSWMAWLWSCIQGQPISMSSRWSTQGQHGRIL